MYLPFKTDVHFQSGLEMMACDACNILNLTVLVETTYIIRLVQFLGAFAEFRKSTIRFVMCVCPHAATRPPLDGFL
jgi:hypothetical protein